MGGIVGWSRKRHRSGVRWKEGKGGHGSMVDIYTGERERRTLEGTDDLDAGVDALGARSKVRCLDAWGPAGFVRVSFMQGWTQHFEGQV